MIKYYERDFTPGFSDGAYFSVKNKDEGEVCYWLADSDGNRAPESVYHELECSNQLQGGKDWKLPSSSPVKYQNILFYCGELDEMCAGYCDENEGVLVSIGLEIYKPDNQPFYIDKDIISKWRYM